MTIRRVASGILWIGVLIAVPVEGQLGATPSEYFLSPLKPSGDLVAPFFDGWYDNGDGSVTFSFGFMNRNLEEAVDIPLGENNYIEPAQFDGGQPTHFPAYDPGSEPARTGEGPVRRGMLRERGAFAVTVPAEMAGTEVVWTLSHAGHTYSVPGRAVSKAYEMSRQPAAFGSLPPLIRFDPSGPESKGREGIMAERVRTSVGTPVTLSALVSDRGRRAGYPDTEEVYPVTATWIRHQGPGPIEFAEESTSIESEGWGEAMTRATFTVPGEYVVRLRVDNFEAPDSRFPDQCCWSNAFIPVTVAP